MHDGDLIGQGEVVMGWVSKLLGGTEPALESGSSTPAVSTSTAARPEPASSDKPSRTRNFGPETLVEMVETLTVEPRRDWLDEQIEVAGETHHVKGIKRVFRESKRPITESGATLEDVDCVLVPEPWNPYDANAVAVLIGVHHVGYIPAETACRYAAPLGRLVQEGRLVRGEARIWAKAESSSMIRARVTICVPEPDELS